MPMSFKIEVVASKIARELFQGFRIYFQILEFIARLIKTDYKLPKYLDVVIAVSASSSATVDDRIKKIDAARENLQDAIAAIDELRSQADANKQDLIDAIRRIEDAEHQKQELSKELAALKQVAEADISAFRRIIGLPTKADIWRERLLGFGSGVLASIIASIIFVLAAKLFQIS